jgi:hypothetical protein
MPRSKQNSKNWDSSTHLRFTVTPPSRDELVLRQAVQNAMEQTFGLTRAFTYFDFVHDETEDGMVIQVATMSAGFICSVRAFISQTWQRCSIFQGRIGSVLRIEVVCSHRRTDCPSKYLKRLEAGVDGSIMPIVSSAASFFSAGSICIIQIRSCLALSSKNPFTSQVIAESKNHGRRDGALEVGTDNANRAIWVTVMEGRTA